MNKFDIFIVYSLYIYKYLFKTFDKLLKIAYNPTEYFHYTVTKYTNIPPCYIVVHTISDLFCTVCILHPCAIFHIFAAIMCTFLCTAPKCIDDFLNDFHFTNFDIDLTPMSEYFYAQHLFDSSLSSAVRREQHFQDTYLFYQFHESVTRNGGSTRSSRPVSTASNISSSTINSDMNSSVGNDADSQVSHSE